MGKRKWKTRVSPDPSSSPHPIRGPRAVWLLTKDCWSVTPSSVVLEQTTHCADNKGRVSPRALACRTDGNAGGRTNGKWICWFRSHFKICILILSWNRFVYTGMHVRILWFASSVKNLRGFLLKSYLKLCDKSTKWFKRMNEIRERYFPFSFRLECRPKITNNSNSFSFLFLPTALRHASFTFWQKNRVIFWSKFWTQAALLRCVNTEEIAKEILPPNFKLQRLQRTTRPEHLPHFPYICIAFLQELIVGESLRKYFSNAQQVKSFHFLRKTFNFN